MKKKVNRGMKIRIFPNEVQVNQIEQTFGCVRHIWNYSLMEKLSVLEMYGKYPKLYKSHKYKSQKDWKRDFEFYKNADSQALNTEQQILNRTFKHWLKGLCKKPRYKGKKNNRNSYTTHTTNDNIKIQGNLIKLPKLEWVKLSSNRRKLPEGAIIKAATVKKTRAGKYKVSLRLEYNLELKERNKNIINTIGLDFSMSQFYIDNKGKRANFPSYILDTENRIKHIDKKMSRQEKGSQRREKTKLKRAKLYEKKNNQLRDFHHQLSRQLVKEYDIIGVETLELKSMKEFKYDRRQVQHMGFKQFLSFLKYKCEEEGVLFFEADKYYPSSKICSSCGNKKKTLPRSQRVYICECGNVLDRDINAAINLATKGVIAYLKKQLEDRTASIARDTYKFATSELI